MWAELLTGSLLALAFPFPFGTGVGFGFLGAGPPASSFARFGGLRARISSTDVRSAVLPYGKSPNVWQLHLWYIHVLGLEWAIPGKDD